MSVEFATYCVSLTIQRVVDQLLCGKRNDFPKADGQEENSFAKEFSS
jgi:hypothetical protein